MHGAIAEARYWQLTGFVGAASVAMVSNCFRASGLKPLLQEKNTSTQKAITGTTAA
jgi:hypothetical protein